MPQRTEAMLDLRFESEERNKKEGSRAAAKKEKQKQHKQQKQQKQQRWRTGNM